MRIRPYLNELDYEYLAEWVNEERIHALWCAGLTDYPVTKEGVGILLEKDAREWGGYGYMVLEDDGTPMGFFCYSVNYEDGSGFMKYVVLDPVLRGKGYGIQMMELALKYAYDITGVSSVKINVFDVNTAARRCYEKAGFVLNAVEEDAFRYKEEKWRRCSMAACKRTKGIVTKS